MRFLLAAALGAVLFCNSGETVFAQSTAAKQRCPAGSSGCTTDNAAERIKERVEEGRRKIGETSNPIKKGQEAGRTIVDCAKCGMDAVTSSPNQTRR